MIHFNDLTPEEIAVRSLLTRKTSDWERRDTPFARWCQRLRAEWAASPAGKLALAECEAKAGKVRRRVLGGGPGAA
jgi:hypothetical protein